MNPNNNNEVNIINTDSESYKQAEKAFFEMNKQEQINIQEERQPRIDAIKAQKKENADARKQINKGMLYSVLGAMIMFIIVYLTNAVPIWMKEHRITEADEQRTETNGLRIKYYNCWKADAGNMGKDIPAADCDNYNQTAIIPTTSTGTTASGSTSTSLSTKPVQQSFPSNSSIYF